MEQKHGKGLAEVSEERPRREISWWLLPHPLPKSFQTHFLLEMPCPSVLLWDHTLLHFKDLSLYRFNKMMTCQ